MQACSDEDVILAGVPFRRWTEERTVATVMAAGERGEGGWILNPNVDVLRSLARHPELRELVAPASLVLADGMPLVWASRLQRCPVPERVAGSSLIWSLPEAAAARGRSVYLLGGDTGVAERAGQVLVERFPGLKVAGTYSPPYGAHATPAGVAEILERLLAAQPDIVFCGFGFPKQERLIVALREHLPAAWFVSCGAAIAFVAGAVPRAPQWMQASGLEWVFRLAQEPRRLFRRYIADDIPFALALLVRAGIAGRRARRDAAALNSAG